MVFDLKPFTVRLRLLNAIELTRVQVRPLFLEYSTTYSRTAEPEVTFAGDQESVIEVVVFVVTLSPVGAAGALPAVTIDTVFERSPLPYAFKALTLKRYAVPAFSPETVNVSPTNAVWLTGTHLTPPSLDTSIAKSVIAAPLSILATGSWLKNFAYRTPVSWWIFVVAGCLAIVIALLTVSVQAIKAAVANPVKSLRSE